MAVITYTWIGGSGSATSPANWTPSGGPPNNGDSAIIPTGTVLAPNDAQIDNQTIYLGSAALNFIGDSSLSLFNPTLDFNTAVYGEVPGGVSPVTSVLNSGGVFISQGSIIANGPAGSTFTININPTGTGSAFVPGYFTNYNQIEVDAGDAMTIAIGPGSELFNTGEILVNGGSLQIKVDSSALAGGLAPVNGAVLIANGGTVDAQASYGTATTGIIPIYAFGDSQSGNTLKIEHIGSFGGQILGFGVNDTIDLGTSLTVGKVAYSSTTGILALEDASGNILDSLYFGSGNFQNGTSTVSGGVAGSFTIGTGTDGNTVLTTSVPNDTYKNATGTWQTGSNWANGTPTALGSAFIGVGAGSPFTLTTGSIAVSVGALTMGSGNSTLQITSNTTVGPYVINEFAGLIEVTSGNTLTATALVASVGTLELDPTALLKLTGRVIPANIGAAGGTITTGGTVNLQVPGGTVLVNGGTINAPASAGGGGGTITVGADGGGTPATITVLNDGSGHAGAVTAAFTELSSDPTSFGVLILNGAGVKWHDQVDSKNQGSTGRIIVGTNNESANSGTLTPPAITSAATLVVENGATLTDDSTSSADQIAATANSAGNVTIETGGIWNTGNGISDGRFGQGLLQVLNGGTVQVTGGGFTAGATTGASGTLVVSGTDSGSGAHALIQFGTSSNGITVGGGGGQGTLTVGSGGTIQMGGTKGIAIGQTAGIGLITVSGTGALINEGTGSAGMFVGQSGTGTLQVQGGGGVTIGANGLNIGGLANGSTVAGVGTVTVSGTNSAITTQGTSGGIVVGSPGTGVLTVSNGGSVSSSTGVFIATGNTSASSGNVTVDNGTLTAATGISAGQSGTGTLQVLNGGTVTIAANGLGIGGGTIVSSGSTTVVAGIGTVTVSGTHSAITTQGTSGGIVVGSPGTGVLNIGNGGAVSTSTGVFIATGGTSTSSGNVTVDNGTLTAATGISVGSSGQGTLTVKNGGLVSNTGTSRVNVGVGAGSSGSIIVNGGTLSDTTGGLGVGNNGASGSLLVEGGGQLVTGGTAAFSDINATGTGQTAAVVVSGGTWTSNGSIIVGDGNSGSGGTGSLDINSSGVVVNAGTANGLFIGIGTSGAAGTVSLETGGSLQAGNASIGQANTLGATVATGTLSVAGGAVQLASLQESGGGTINVSSGSLFVNGGATIGQSGTGAALTVTGGNVTTGALTLAASPGSTGTITVSGGTLIAGILDISQTGTSSGSLTVGTGGVIQVTSATINAGGVISLSGGLLDPTAAVSLNGGGVISGFGTLQASMADNGSITAGGGTLDITGGITGGGILSLNAGAILRSDGSIDVNPSVSFNTGTNETLILGTPGTVFTNTVNGLAETDKFEFNFGGVSITAVGLDVSGHTITVTESNSKNYQLTNVSFAPGSATGLTFGADNVTGDQFIQVICFARGTQLATPSGEVPVERLAVGDTVLTLDGKAEPIVWIGTGRQLVTPGHRSAATPVIVRRGALAHNVPHRDLRVTKGHSLFVDDVLIPAEFLVNHRSIIWDDRAREIEIYHIELAQHGVLLADGAPAESYRDDGNRWLFHNANATWHLPRLPPCAPVLTGGAVVDAAWRRLLDRSGPRPGLPMTDEPDLHLLVDGQRVDSHTKSGDVHVFRLPRRPTSVRIVSRAGAPDELGVARDPRSLGVALRQIKLWRGARLHLIEAFDPSLDEGFHPFEEANGFRWTDGDAKLPAELLGDIDGPCELALHVACTAQYPLFDDLAEVAA